MFGYLTAYQDKLSEEDRNTYQAYYCGLCRTLAGKFGLRSGLILEYDLVFLALLYSSLYEEEETEHRMFCPLHMKKVVQTELPSMEYAAEINLMLAYHNYRDRAHDSLNRAADRAAKRLKRHYHRTAERLVRQKQAVEKYMRELLRYEKEPDDNPDRTANLTGEMLSEVFLMKEDEFSRYLRPMFYYLGKFIYLADAFCDVFEDEKSGNYNPYRGICHAPDFNDRVREHLEAVMGECTGYFEMLPLFRYREILRNILYSGVWLSYGKAVGERTEKEQDGK